MGSRPWLILAAVALARIGFGYQYQTVASLGPELMHLVQFDDATLGTLIGAIAGGGKGRRAARCGPRRPQRIELRVGLSIPLPSRQLPFRGRACGSRFRPGPDARDSAVAVPQLRA